METTTTTTTNYYDLSNDIDIALELIKAIELLVSNNELNTSNLEYK